MIKDQINYGSFFIKANIKNMRKLRQVIAILSITVFLQLLFPQLAHATPINIVSSTDSNSLLFKVNVSNETIYQIGEITVSDGNDITSVTVSESPKDEKVTDTLSEKEIIKQYVLEEAKKAGLNPREVELIIHCESTWNSKATHKNRNGSIDAGLWQINSIHKNISFEEKMDYKVATKWALEKRLRDGNWSAWYCAKKMGIK